VASDGKSSRQNVELQLNINRFQIDVYIPRSVRSSAEICFHFSSRSAFYLSGMEKQRIALLKQTTKEINTGNKGQRVRQDESTMESKHR
jgi:hypothetical protein